MKYENSLPNKIVSRVMESTGFEINVSKLANSLNKPIPSVWNKVVNMRRWDAETWLKTLWSLGYARYVKNDLSGGHILIRVNLTEFEIAKLNNLKNENIFIKYSDHDMN